MSHFCITKQFVLISTTVLALGATASANTCTDALFRVYANPLLNNDGGDRVDSLYSSNSTKYNYENGKLVHIHKDKRENSSDYMDMYIYYTSDESALKRKGREYLVSDCSVKDTLCFKQKVYDEGMAYEGSLTTKITKNYVSHETIEPAGNKFEEVIMMKDTVIDRTILGSKSNPQKVSEMLYSADKKDDKKCYINMSGKTYGEFAYKPNDKGYSIAFSITEGKTSFEYFVTNAGEAQAIRKTLKPVMISPKARYFDLLGRYKFTK